MFNAFFQNAQGSNTISNEKDTEKVFTLSRNIPLFPGLNVIFLEDDGLPILRRKIKHMKIKQRNFILNKKMALLHSLEVLNVIRMAILPKSHIILNNIQRQ